MENRVLIKRLVIGLSAAITLSACQTVSVPKFDFVKTPEFSEDAANIDPSFPSVDDAPEVPTDVRSAQEWDKDVRVLQELQKNALGVEPSLSETEGDARFEALKAKAQAYKKDDPASGPVEGFPKYKPRRR